MEYRLRDKKGQYRWMLDKGTPRFLETGEFLGFIGSCIDITVRKEAEEKLRHALSEKELLIKEIHHRVKNNLQLISSILYIKMSDMEESSAREFLQDTRYKIRSIALIHERLLQSESVDQVDVSDYLTRLVQDIEASQFRAELRIRYQLEIETHLLNLDIAIHCGLIINELLTNSIKHAFRGQTQGTIFISLTRVGDEFTLVVSDNGSGLPENIAPGKSGSFGMQLIDIFIRQLEGTVQIDRTTGTRFTVVFQLPAPAN